MSENEHFPFVSGHFFMPQSLRIIRKSLYDKLLRLLVGILK